MDVDTFFELNKTVKHPFPNKTECEIAAEKKPAMKIRGSLNNSQSRK